MATLLGSIYNTSPLVEVEIPLGKVDTLYLEQDRHFYKHVQGVQVEYTRDSGHINVKMPASIDFNTMVQTLNLFLGFKYNGSSIDFDWIDQFPEDNQWKQIANSNGTLVTNGLSIANATTAVSLRVGSASRGVTKESATNDGGFIYVPDTQYMGIYEMTKGTQNWTFDLNYASLVMNYQVSKDPGDKGFTPIKTIVDIRGGGKTSGSKAIYTTDVLEQPGAPDESKASAIGSGFITAYDITEANLANVGACIWSSTFTTALVGLFIDPIDAIISLNVFPYTPNIGSSTPVKLLNHVCTTADLGIDASAAPLTSQFRVIDFGTLNIYEVFESFLDYANTNFSLYLPFIGEVSLPINEVMGGTINVQYTIDYFTGMCIANVLCYRSIPFSLYDAADQYAQHSYQGNCAIQIPISAKDYGAMVGSLINACASGLRDGIETGSVAVGAASAGLHAAGDAMSGGWKPSVKTKGSIQANAGYCSVLYPYITIERPIAPVTDSYQTAHGYMSYTDGTLSAYEGKCVCTDINLSGISNATDSEKERIRAMCREGVYV